MSADTVADVLFARYPALGRIVAHLTPETSHAVLMALGKRADSPEKLARFRAIEFFGLQVYETAYEQLYGSPCGGYLHLSWAAEAKYQSREVWRRLYGGLLFIASDEAYEGITSFANMPANDDPAVLSGFVGDTELMGILGVEPGWTPDVKRIDPALDLTATDLDEGLS